VVSTSNDDMPFCHRTHRRQLNTNDVVRGSGEGAMIPGPCLVT
jgi:hypothetical protein